MASENNQEKIAGLAAFETCICLNLRKATRRVTHYYESVLAPTGLKITQLPILAQAVQSGPVSMTALSQTLVMDRTTLTRNLQPLIRLGYLLVTPDANDRRARMVTVTAAGREALTAALPLWQQAQAVMLDQLGHFSAGVLTDNLRATIDAARKAAE